MRMDDNDMEVADRFLTALETAARTGQRDAVFPLVAADVEWVTAMRTLRGIDELRERLTWGSPPEHLDLEFEERDRSDLGDGHIVSEVHQVYRVKGSGDFAYERTRRIDLTIRDGKVSRYEMRIVA